MLYYVTGSDHKFEMAKNHLKKDGIKIKQKILDIKEIQSDSIEEIAIDKARKAFAIIKQPLFVNDSGWFISALNGFPGAFMAFINKMLTAEDIIRMMKDKKDRKITLKQLVVYIDKKKIKVIEHNSIGKVVNKLGPSKGKPSEMISSFSRDNISVTDRRAKGMEIFAQEAELWHDLAVWYKNNHK